MARPSLWEKKLTIWPRRVGAPPVSTRPSRRQSSAVPVAAESWLASGHQRATGAIILEDIALDGFPERDAVGIHGHAQGERRRC